MSSLRPPRPATILVVGRTGAGKSTFVNCASKSTLGISDGLLSCTDIVQKSESFTVDDYKVTLVDTPGFNDTTKSDADILHMICEYLSSEYRDGHLLHGLIYLHPITDNRASGSSMRNFRVIQQLCGQEALKNFIIVTNMWNQIDLLVGESRESELRSDETFFKPALTGGATMLRSHNTIQSVHLIVRHLLRGRPCPLAIQRELVDQRKRVVETSAGYLLLGDFTRQQQKHRAELNKLRDELNRAQDERLRLDIEAAIMQAEVKNAQLGAERAKLIGRGPRGFRAFDSERRRDSQSSLPSSSYNNASSGNYWFQVSLLCLLLVIGLLYWLYMET